MSRVEILKEWFIPVPSRTVNGKTVPAPAEAVQRIGEIRNDWYKDHPYLRQEEKPMISMGPAVRDGQPGYSVRMELIYKPKSVQIPSPVNLPLPEGPREGVSSN